MSPICIRLVYSIHKGKVSCEISTTYVWKFQQVYCRWQICLTSSSSTNFLHRDRTPLYMPCIPISGKVDAFKKAAMHVIELKGYRPKKTGVNALVPNRSTGGRPAYSLLQLYHTFSLKLVIACYFIIFHFVSFCHWLDYCAYYWATDSFLKKLSYRNNKTKSKQWKNTTTIDIKKYQKHWN
jgi:hypothetical protein